MTDITPHRARTESGSSDGLPETRPPFDGTYASPPGDRVADNTDKTRGRKVEKDNPVIGQGMPITPFSWELDGPKVPTVEELCTTTPNQAEGG